MKKDLLRRFFATLMFLAITTITWAYDFVSGGIYYNINSDMTSVTVTYNIENEGSYSGSINIPSIVRNGSKYYNVTCIGEKAFYACFKLTSVTIGNSVTNIGEDAFYLCINLQSITIPNSVTSIGYRAFGDCRALTSVIIPENMTSIGESAFYCCSSLTSINIPSSVTSIEHGAFIQCSGLTSITFPESLTSIGEDAFYSCSSLTSINIPGSVTSIGTRAFASCSAIESITVDESNPVFDSRDQSNAIIETSSNTLILGCNNTFIPESVTNIGNSSFYGCLGLAAINIPNSVTSIGSWAFYSCRGLTSITIPNSVTSIERLAFTNCSSLTSVTLNSNEIVSKTYTSSSNLKTIFGSQVSEYILGEGITSIGDYAFYGCSGLTSISIPNSVTRIGNHAFSHCSSLSKIYCYAENVPSTESELIFDETPINSAKLFVPKGSVESYKAYSPWKDFGKVLPYNTTIYYIVDGEIYMQYMIEADTPITPEPIPTKEGYTFSGWSAIPETMPADDVIVTGTFSINKYTLTYLLNGEVYLTETVVYGTPLEPEPALRREGYTFTGWSTIPETMPASDVIIKGAFYINGDVNTDNEVDVVDVVDIARFVVGTPAITFMEVLADINKDGTVNIGDAVVLVNDIVGNQNFARIQLDTNRDASNNMLTLTRRNGNLSLNLKNESCYSAFQFDLYVPEDIEVSRIMLNSERKNYHQLLYNKIEDGHYRIAVMSTVNNIFNGHDGELLNITLDEIPDNEISIRNILFFDSEGQSYQFDDMESTITTQIEELSSTISKEKWVIYDLRARKSEKLQRGVNIVNGKKILY